MKTVARMLDTSRWREVETATEAVEQFGAAGVDAMADAFKADAAAETNARYFVLSRPLRPASAVVRIADGPLPEDFNLELAASARGQLAYGRGYVDPFGKNPAAIEVLGKAIGVKIGPDAYVADATMRSGARAREAEARDDAYQAVAAKLQDPRLKLGHVFASLEAERMEDFTLGRDGRDTIIDAQHGTFAVRGTAHFSDGSSKPAAICGRSHDGMPVVQAGFLAEPGIDVGDRAIRYAGFLVRSDKLAEATGNPFHARSKIFVEPKDLDDALAVSLPPTASPTARLMHAHPEAMKVATWSKETGAWRETGELEGRAGLSHLKGAFGRATNRSLDLDVKDLALATPIGDLHETCGKVAQAAQWSRMTRDHFHTRDKRHEAERQTARTGWER